MRQSRVPLKSLSLRFDAALLDHLRAYAHIVEEETVTEILETGGRKELEQRESALPVRQRVGIAEILKAKGTSIPVRTHDEVMHERLERKNRLVVESFVEGIEEVGDLFESNLLADLIAVVAALRENMTEERPSDHDHKAAPGILRKFVDELRSDSRGPSKAGEHLDEFRDDASAQFFARLTDLQERLLPLLLPADEGRTALAWSLETLAVGLSLPVSPQARRRFVRLIDHRLQPYLAERHRVCAEEPPAAPAAQAPAHRL